jgi:hypothetical protein
MFCQMKPCAGSGEPVRINGQVTMQLCPRHALELKDEGFEVLDMNGSQPWLWSTPESGQPIQADGDGA